MGPLSEFGSTLPWLLVLGIATAYLLRRTYRRFGPTRDASPIAHVPRPGKSAAGQPFDPSAEVMRQEVHLHETARELSARLDSKTSVLLLLVGRAERQIERLEALIDQSESGDRAAGAAASQDVPSAKDAIESRADDGSGDPLHCEIFRLADQGYSEVTIANRVGQRLSEVHKILRERTGV